MRSSPASSGVSRRSALRPNLRPTPLFVLVLVVLALVIVQVLVLPVFHRRLYGPMGFAMKGADSPRYIDPANRLRAGHLPSSYDVLSSGYVAIIALSKLLGLGLAGVVVLQLAMAVPAAMALYDIGRKAADPVVGLLAALIFVGNPFVARWRHYVLTDSLFESFVVLTLWAALRARRNKTGGVLFLVLTASVTALLRPNGGLIALAAVTYVVLARSSHRLRTGLAFVAIWASLGAVALVATRLANVEDFYNIPDGIRRGISVAPYGGHPNGIVISMPRSSAIGSRNIDAVQYAIVHPVATGRLFMTRTLYEISAIRPGSSQVYNLLAPTGLCLTYVLALVGGMRCRDRQLLIAIAALLVPQLFVLGSVPADGDSRYILWFIPLLGVLTAIGIESTFQMLLALRRRGSGVASPLAPSDLS